ncbi:hypothetical protein PIB30_006229 [Stylosanthes scabra]|uniref:Uncharacterized protein n=1 Tax=Stylosanthes scabra TaxID=79078 RepID=A0ABU6Z1A3_9FABA|nr:hypothetical protein [Stylosanthes scabra]
MPIYGDYHGDSKNSSISTWDQIQISLKSLLSSYRPILCDSAIVESFLSDQPQTQLSADFEQNSVSENSDQEIDNTDQEITDLEFQFQSEFATTRSSKFTFNQNSSSGRTDPAKIQVQIHPNQSKNHHSEYEIQKETITDSDQIQEDSTSNQISTIQDFQQLKISVVHSQKLNPKVPYSTENKNSNLEIRSVVLTADGDVDDGVVMMKKEAMVELAEDSAVTVEGRRTYAAFTVEKERLTEGVVIGAEDSASLTDTVKNLHDDDRDRLCSLGIGKRTGAPRKPGATGRHRSGQGRATPSSTYATT